MGEFLTVVAVLTLGPVVVSIWGVLVVRLVWFVDDVVQRLLDGAKWRLRR